MSNMTCYAQGGHEKEEICRDKRQYTTRNQWCLFRHNQHRYKSHMKRC